jgi:Arc/MetJ family transcription regulator
MKMTMHIDEALLDRVMYGYGYASKTETVEMALRELDRRMRMQEIGRTGMGLTAEELKEAVDPDYDPITLRLDELKSDPWKR